MHDSCMAFVEQQLNAFVAREVQQVRNTVGEVRAWSTPVRIVEFGSQDVNGTPRNLPLLAPKPGLTYIGIDIAAGPGVDIVMDARDVTADDLGDELADVVICTNVFEHDEHWPELVMAAHRILRPGGWLIAQCAGPGFQVHSGRSESLVLEPDEWYRNVPRDEMENALKLAGFGTVRAWFREQWPHDTTGLAIK